MNRPETTLTIRSNTQRGFTLIEIMVVIAIIVILVGISTMVGTAVINSGKNKSTLGIIQSLDEALGVYINKKGDIPPALVEIPFAKLPERIQSQMPGDVSAYYPAADARASESRSRVDNFSLINSVAFFIESASVVPKVQDIITGINPKYVQMYSADEDLQPFLLTVFDAWGNPIRYVHPKFDGIIERVRRDLGDAGEPLNIANPNKPFFVEGALPPAPSITESIRRIRMNFIRRNRLVEADYGGGSTGGGMTALSDFELLPDSDGGRTVGSRPYFYSAGPDGDPSTLEDNVYSISPKHVDPGVE